MKVFLLALGIDSKRHLQRGTATEALETLWALCNATWACGLKPSMSPPGIASKHQKHYLHNVATFCNGYHLNLQQLKKQ